MKNTIISLIEEKGSLELKMCFKQYWNKFGGTMVDFRHSSYMMLDLGASDEVVKEFQDLHDEYWESRSIL